MSGNTHKRRDICGDPWPPVELGVRSPGTLHGWVVLWCQGCCSLTSISSTRVFLTRLISVFVSWSWPVFWVEQRLIYCICSHFLCKICQSWTPPYIFLKKKNWFKNSIAQLLQTKRFLWVCILYSCYKWRLILKT